MPSVDVKMEDIPDVKVDNNMDHPNLSDIYDNDDFHDFHDDANDGDKPSKPYTSKDELKDGDQSFMANIPCEAKFIWATSNILQRLAEAFHKNTLPLSFHKSIPTHLHDFEDLFVKLLFDCLHD